MTHWEELKNSENGLPKKKISKKRSKMDDLKVFEDEYNEILNQLSDPELISDLQGFEELSKRKKKLEKIIELSKEIEDAKNKLAESREIIKSEHDRDLVLLAESDVETLEKRSQTLEKQLEEVLKEGESESKSSSAIIEIRAGAGGDEAAIFAGDLFRMYSKFAENQNWKSKILDSHAAELGGYKEIIFEISGKDAYPKMKYEGGVHRVQRIPRTEKTGRVHTSTASVAVLMKPKPAEIKIRPQDLKIDIAKASGPGGQNVNKRMTAVRITHLPTGIMVKSMTERSLPQNKENALSILAAKLLEIEEEKRTSNIGNKRKKQIGKAKRVEKIRTYNFPQDRITDHRIKKNWHGIEEIMEGNMDKIVKSMQKAG